MKYHTDKNIQEEKDSNHFYIFSHVYSNCVCEFKQLNVCTWLECKSVLFVHEYVYVYVWSSKYRVLHTSVSVAI